MGSKGRITIDAVDEKTGGFVNFLDATARVVGPDGGSQTVRLAQTGPGRYVGSFDASKTGSYVASVTQKTPDGKTRVAGAGLSVAYSPEYAALTPNTALLLRAADITGGRALKSGADVFTARRERRLPSPLAMSLLLLALLLFPFDVAVRRLQLRPLAEGATDALDSAKAKIEEGIAARRPSREAQKARVSTTSVARLATRKNELSEETDAAEITPVVSPPPAAVVWNRDETSAPIVSEKTPPPDPGGDYRARLLNAKKRAKNPDEK